VPRRPAPTPSRAGDEPAATGQYFEATPAAPSKPTTVHLVLPDLTTTLQSDRAVFSADRVDAGTKYLLLEATDPPDRGHLLDLGCGYGPIAVTLSHRAPAATVWAVDVNERAVDLCAANGARLGHGRVHASVVRDDRPFGAVPDDVTFAGIWSNPPIRIGKAALHDLLARWLPRLEPGGHAHLVVQKHLGSDSLQRWLVEQGWAADRLGSRAGFRILDVHRPDA